MYYDIHQTLTYNALFNFIVGNRGCGKTYGSKRQAIKNYLKTGAQFVYVRRYKQEFKKNKLFFADVSAEFPDVDFKVDGMQYWINGGLAGFALALSTSKIEKSTPFPAVEMIIFDEFIIDKGTYHYLPDEVINFLELYETIARMRDNVRVFFLSNAITMTNPYFMYFNITLPRGSLIYAKNDVLIQLVQDPDFIEKKKSTRFGRLIDGTEYAQYSIENQFLRDNKTFIEKKTGSPQYFFTFLYKGSKYGVWIDYAIGKVWVSADIDPFCRIVYCMTQEDHSPNTLLIKSLSKAVLFKKFIDCYKAGNVYFESIKIKNIVYEVIRMTLI